MTQGLKNWAGSSTVPAAFSLFPADIGHPPREWAERFFNVQRWTEIPRGGHFAAMEEPELSRQTFANGFASFSKLPLGLEGRQSLHPYRGL
jgi:hypothetical protein